MKRCNEVENIPHTKPLVSRVGFLQWDERNYQTSKFGFLVWWPNLQSDPLNFEITQCYER